MTPIHDIEIKIGRNFALVAAVNVANAPADLTGYTVQAQMRLTAADADPAATFNCGVTDNTIFLRLDDSITAGIAAGTYVYDVCWTTPTGSIDSLFGGRAFVSLPVTR